MFFNTKKIIKRIIVRTKHIGKRLYFSNGAEIWAASKFEGYNKVGSRSFFGGNMGLGTYICNDCCIYADVGRFCCISSCVRTVYGKHPTEEWVSLHPAFYSTRNQSGITFADETKYGELTNRRIQIGNDVWIGDSVLLLEGISIGDGAIIGAGAVVTKDVEPFSVVAGVPAKTIKYRFPIEERQKLLDIKWWDYSLQWIKENAGSFCNMDSFLACIGEDKTK